MLSRRVIGTLIAGVALGVASMPMASTAFAASSTKGLVSLSLQGVGSGSLASGPCSNITCQGTDLCECLAATYTLIGNHGFAKGDLNVQLSVDTTPEDLPISNVGSCNPATGIGTIKDVKGNNSLTVNISGLECPTLGTPDVFNGTYVVTSGTGKYSSAAGGTGSINGSQVPISGGLSQAAITGSAQP